MKSTKQTVYLPVNDEWVKDKPTLMSSDGEWVCNLSENIGYFFTPEQLNEYTQSVIKQALETAAEEADIKAEFDYGLDEIYEYHVADKESITNTFSKTFKKFEV